MWKTWCIVEVPPIIMGQCFLAIGTKAHASKLGLTPTSSTANPDGSSSSSTTPSAGKEAVGSLTGAGN